MSQRAVEQALGKMLTDSRFREAFLTDPAGAAEGAGLSLTQPELDALTRVPRRALAGLAARLDDRICRLCVDPRPGDPGARPVTTRRRRTSRRIWQLGPRVAVPVSGARGPRTRG